MSLTADGIRRARVRAQLLAPTPAHHNAEAVVASIIGIQAQDEMEAALAIRSRSVDLVKADITAAMVDARSLVLMWSLRGTRHLHHVDDVRWLLNLLGPRFASGSSRRKRQLGLDGALGDAAVRAVRTMLESEGPLTRSEIKERLARHGLDPSGQAPIHVLHRAALEGVLCIVPSRTGEETYVLLDDWVPHETPVDPESSAARLAQRYLAAYGPARPHDLAAWSGLGLGVAKRAWAAIADKLTELDGPRGKFWILSSQQTLLAEAVGEMGPIRLLAGFDALILGYEDRTLTVPPEYARRVNAGGGLIRPTVLADGLVVGTWRHWSYRSTQRLDINQFAEPAPSTTSGIESDAADIGRFLGQTVSVHVGV